ncbi:MAG TPA: hypothetical protein VHC48_17580 [Puia sp.]|nr:hypothetical protein [Puia sp.]
MSQKNNTCSCSHHEKGYTLALPDDRPVLSGTVVALEDNNLYIRDTSKYQRIKSEVLKKGFAFLIIATGVPVDLYFSEKSLIFVDTLIEHIFARYRLPEGNIFLLGVLAAGHRALKYIEYCKRGRSLYNPAIKGVVLNECALDWIRRWYECRKQVRNIQDEARFFEGTMITYLFNENLKATPVTDIDMYIRFSTYSYFDIQMEKPGLFKDLSVRAYTYADLACCFSARGKSIYENNYPDMSGFISEQQLAGNGKAELVVFLEQTAPTWDMVDKAELADWMVRQSAI